MSRASRILFEVTGTPTFQRGRPPLEGSRGDTVEDAIILACNMMGLQYVKNSSLATAQFRGDQVAGKRWDIRALGGPWSNNLKNKDINIKHAKTPWAFGSRNPDILLNIPWRNFPIQTFNPKAAGDAVRKWLKQYRYEQTWYLKARAEKTESDLIYALKYVWQNRSPAALKHVEEILAKPNWKIDTLGKNYNVRFLTDSSNTPRGHVSGIVLEKGGSRFMAAERPTEGRAVRFNIVNERGFKNTAILAKKGFERWESFDVLEEFMSQSLSPLVQVLNS